MLRFEGRDVLRPMAVGTADPLEAANFPLVPYANRIAHGRFAFEGVDYQLPANFGDHPHTLHGVGWQAPWAVMERTASGARLRHDHAPAPAWPWRYRAEQAVTLGRDGARFELSVRNLDDRAMPAGLGFHPYFPRTADASIGATLGGAWLTDDTLLPTERVAADHFGDWASRAPVERDGLVDHCHDGWDGVAAIATNGLTIAMMAEGTGWLHLYLPPHAAFFCAEPASHLPDAINRSDRAALGLRVLQPGETMRIAMALSIA
jgi:aldose 1-epimerase